MRSAFPLVGPPVPPPRRPHSPRQELPPNERRWARATRRNDLQNLTTHLLAFLAGGFTGVIVHHVMSAILR